LVELQQPLCFFECFVDSPVDANLNGDDKGWSAEVWGVEFDNKVGVVSPRAERTLFWWRIGPDDGERLGEICCPR
jgi:hypothetical protein